MVFQRAILLAFFTALSSAASFDCAKARTPSEKLICSTPELSKLDDEAAAAYRTALATGGKAVRERQLAWLKYILSACRDVEQMRQAYRLHVAALRPPAADSASTDDGTRAAPKFTMLRFRLDEYRVLTQIRSDPPNPVIDRFNAWLVGTVAEHPTATYYDDDTEVVAGRYVSAYLLTEDYSPGAAHGAPVRDCLTLDLKTGRKVTLESLFRAGAKYAPRLAELVDTELEASAKHGEWQYDRQQVALGLGDGPTDLYQLVSGGLGIHYRPYILGPYSSGDANVFIPFAKLADLADPNGALAAVGKLPFTRKHDWERSQPNH